MYFTEEGLPIAGFNKNDVEKNTDLFVKEG